MANNLVSIAIWTASGTTPVLATSGSYDLRVSPYSATGIAGVHQGAGVWSFTGLSDTADYKLYNSATSAEVAGFTGGGTNTRVFFDGDLQNYIRHNGSIAFTANQAMGGFKITGATAATTTGDYTVYEQVIRTTGAQTGISGVKVFTDLLSMSPSTISITADGNLTTKKYVDDLFGGAVGVVQSTQKIKLVPSRATNDTYSQTTLSGCVGQLATTGSLRGNILIEALNISGNTYALSDDETWCGDRIDLTGENLPKINVTASAGNSLTFDSKIKGIYLYNSGTTNWTFVNFIFEDCVFYFNGNLTFTSCTFRGTNGVRLPNSKTLTIANSVGHGKVVYNDDIGTVTISGTQCSDISSMAVGSLGIS